MNKPLRLVLRRSTPPMHAMPLSKKSMVQRTKYRGDGNSMPNPTGNPLIEVRITRRREESAISLLARQWLHRRCSNALAALLFHRSSMIQRPLLPVIHEVDQRRRQAEDDEAFNQPLVNRVVVVVAAGHRVRSYWIGKFILFDVMVVRVVVPEEVGYPFAERPVWLGFFASQ